MTVKRKWMRADGCPLDPPCKEIHYGKDCVGRPLNQECVCAEIDYKSLMKVLKWEKGDYLFCPNGHCYKFHDDMGPGSLTRRPDKDKVADVSALTPEEIKIITTLGDVWNSFCLLPEQHPADASEMLAAIHRAQISIMKRPTVRKYPKLFIDSDHEV